MDRCTYEKEHAIIFLTSLSRCVCVLKYARAFMCRGRYTYIWAGVHVRARVLLHRYVCYFIGSTCIVMHAHQSLIYTCIQTCMSICFVSTQSYARVYSSKRTHTGSYAMTMRLQSFSATVLTTAASCSSTTCTDVPKGTYLYSELRMCVLDSMPVCHSLAVVLYCLIVAYGDMCIHIHGRFADRCTQKYTHTHAEMRELIPQRERKGGKYTRRSHAAALHIHTHVPLLDTHVPDLRSSSDSPMQRMTFRLAAIARAHF